MLLGAVAAGILGEALGPRAVLWMAALTLVAGVFSLGFSVLRVDPVNEPRASAE